MLKDQFNEAELRARKRLYGVWGGMIRRCENPNCESYRNYGGRGITVCAEWHDFDEFFYWAIANGYDGNAPRGKCTIDRIDNDGNYEPGNCRWVNMMVQSWNKRPAVRKDKVVTLEEINELFDELEALGL